MNDCRLGFRTAKGNEGASVCILKVIALNNDGSLCCWNCPFNRNGGKDDKN